MIKNSTRWLLYLIMVFHGAFNGTFIWQTSFAMADDDDEEENEEGPTWVHVPEHLRGKGYKLQSGHDLIPLESKRFQSPDPDWLRRVDLIAPDGRVVDSERIYLNERGLKNFSPTTMRVSLLLGSAYVHGDSFEKLFLDGAMSHTGVEFIYQPSSFGVMVNLVTLEEIRDRSIGNSTLTAAYKESQTRLGVTYDFVPFRDGSSVLGRMHTMVYGGALSANMSASIGDDAISLEDEDQQYGPFAGFELRWPVLACWLGGRLDYTYHKIKMPDLDIDLEAVQHHLTFGGSYAF